MLALPRLAVAAGALLALLADSARAEFPDREIRVVCGFAPGGACDIVSRLIAEHTAPIFGQRVIVENRAGAGGKIAMEFVARSAPDGHTVYTCAAGQMSMLPELPGPPLAVDPGRDMAPLAALAVPNYVLVVPVGRPWRSMEELVAHARANPGRLNYGSAGGGTMQQLAAETFKHFARLDISHIPYRGAAPAIVDLTAGRIDMMFTNLADVTGQIQGDQVRVLAFSDDIGSEQFPNVPRTSQTWPDFVVGGFFGVCGAAGTPRAAAERWHDAMRRIAANPAVRERLLSLGLVPRVQGPDEFGETIARDRQRFGAIIRAAGIQQE
ncbi:MAG TPA: tripartite tricarboxylate transporter substrate binding protein [Falsiroseomonas sp.]|jgi:tripartite-type tricarboxylate transporter receptor subunit TctC|nr:tripartite tricarboxylate transporter substrate binding protein [Falsiroseomonas sp.]